MFKNNKISWTYSYFYSMCKEYTNVYVLKWSFWIVTATCCFNQVKLFNNNYNTTFLVLPSN